MAWSPDCTTEGCLPPFEVAKAYALHIALEEISQHLGKPAYDLVGKRSHAWIAECLELKGGGSPSERAVRLSVARCQQPGWHPGAQPDQCDLWLSVWSRSSLGRPQQQQCKGMRQRGDSSNMSTRRPPRALAKQNRT